MTSKDRADVRFAIENEVDYIALSFVRTAGDVDVVRQIREQVQRYSADHRQE